MACRIIFITMDDQSNNTETQATPNTIRSLPRRQLIITMVGVMLAMFLASLDQTIVGTALPKIMEDLGGHNQYTWVATSYLIASTITVPIVGKLTDIYGRKWFYVAGLSIFIIASILCGLSQTIMQLILFRGLQGIGGGIMIANAFIVVGDLFPPSERGKYQGLVAAVFGLSSVIGPILGGFITDNYGWHWVFFVNIPFGLLTIALFMFFFPNLRPDTLKHKIDFAGIAALILAVLPCMLALSWAGVTYPWLSAQIIGMFVFSALMIVVLIAIETRAEEPIMPLWLFKNPVVAISMIILFIIGFGMIGGIIFIPLFFQNVLGTSATASGSFLMPMMLGVVSGSIISGQILSRAGGRYRLQGVFGLAFIALGLWFLSTMTTETSNKSAIIYIIILGFGIGNTMPLYVIAVQNALPHTVLGIATSSTTFFRQMGAAFGLAILGSLLNTRFASEYPDQYSPEIQAQIESMHSGSQPLLSDGEYDLVNSLVHDPQKLLSTDIQETLFGITERFGDEGAQLIGQIMAPVNSSLSFAITEVFLIGFYIILVAWVLNFFIKEIPLRKRN